jgi:nitroreductase
MNPADAFSTLLRSHRSIRKFKSDPIDPALIETICAESVAGSSSSGNLNTFAIVLTEDPARREKLYALHMEQEMIRQAPLLVTFCADTFRTRRWLRIREARDNFNNLQGFVVAAFDAMILAQSAALAFESRGLGICYLGTTIDACDEIADFLELPETCIPVTTLVVGWPDEDPAKRDRLPLASYLHRETYRQHDDTSLLDLYAEREVKGWNRYRAMGPEIMQAMDEHGITSLAQFYTSDLKYAPARCEATSRRLYRLLRDKGFTDRLLAEAAEEAGGLAP